MPIPTPLHEPHKIKTVRPIAFPSLEERKRHLLGAKFNVFNLTPNQVTFDMASYGTSAMSQEQIARCRRTINMAVDLLDRLGSAARLSTTQTSSGVTTIHTDPPTGS